MVSGITARRLKILFVVEEIFPDRTGGVHTYVYQVAKGLSVKGHKVCILTRQADNSLPRREDLNGVTVYRYGFKNYGFTLPTQLSCVINIYKEFNDLMKDHSFDLINLHSPQAAFGVNLSMKSRAVPKVYTFHALQYAEELLASRGKKYTRYDWRRYLKPLGLPVYLWQMRWLERRALTNCDKIITLSDFTAKSVIDIHRISSEKIVQIPGGVDIDSFRPAPDKNRVREILNISKTGRALFTLRRLVPRMGLDNLIRAMPAVLAEYPALFLLIGGEGPLESGLRRLIKDLNLEGSVKLLGYIDEDKVPLYYQAADLFVLPSRALEGFGMVTLEALSCGTPVLGTPVGGTVEILSKLDENLLFKGTDPGSIARLISSILGDPRRLKAVRGRCRQFILDNYAWDRSVAETEKLFFDAVIHK